MGDSDSTLPEPRVVGVSNFAGTDCRVVVQRSLLVAVILPFEWRDALCVLFHDVQQLVANAPHRVRRLLAVVTHQLVVYLQRECTITIIKIYMVHCMHGLHIKHNVRWAARIREIKEERVLRRYDTTQKRLLLYCIQCISGWSVTPFHPLTNRSTLTN